MATEDFVNEQQYTVFSEKTGVLFQVCLWLRVFMKTLASESREEQTRASFSLL